MDSLRRVYWSEGLFLTPQVFEQQDAFHNGLWKALWRVLGPNAWGVRHLEMRDDALREGKFDVVSLEVITRRGEVLRYGIESKEDNCQIRPASLDRVFDDDRTEIGVYLAVAERASNADNIMNPEELRRSEQQARRFVAGEIDASDDFHPTSAERTAIGLADYVVQFLLDTDPGFANAKGRSDCFRIAKLQKVSNGTDRLQNFAPASMTVGASPVLTAMVRNMFSQVARRAAEYEEMKNERSGMHGHEASSKDALVKSMLLVLNAANAEFRIIGSAQDTPYRGMRCHPEQVYNRLRVLVAELSTFSAGVSSDGVILDDQRSTPLPDYDHENPYPCFEQLSKVLKTTLDALVISVGDQIRLTHTGRHYEAELPDSFFGGPQATYYLAIDAGTLSRDRIVSGVGQLRYKLSSGTMADRIIDAAVPGIDLETLQTLPYELSILTSRFTCFRIDRTSADSNADWRRVESEKVIKFWAPDLDPTASTILVIKSEPN